MAQESPLVSTPLGVDKDSPPPVVGEGCVRGHVAPPDGRGESIKQSPTLFVVGDDIRVLEVLLDGVAGCRVGADLAAGRSPLTEVPERDLVGGPSTVTTNNDSVSRGGDARNGKFPEPVSSARERVLALEATWLASSQEVPQSTR